MQVPDDDAGETRAWVAHCRANHPEMGGPANRYPRRQPDGDPTPPTNRHA